MENKSPKKTNPIKNWFAGVHAEFSSRIGSSIKRVIKFVGVSMIPVLYAVICILAFWNPIPGIGRSPVAFLDNEQKVIVASRVDLNLSKDSHLEDLNKVNNDKNANTFDPDALLKLVEDAIKKHEGESDINIIQEIIKELGDVIQIGKWGLLSVVQDRTDPTKAATEFDTTKTDYKDLFLDKPIDISSGSKTKVFIYKMNSWDLFKQLLTVVDKGSDDKSTVFGTSEISEQKITFSNIHYLAGQEAKDAYKGKKYFLQINAQDNTLVGQIEATQKLLVLGTTGKQPIQSKLQIWTTFARNFIFGYYLNTLNQFKESIPVQLIDKELIELSKSKLDQNPNDAVGLFIKNKILGEENSIGLVSKAADVTIQGGENPEISVYGIGLGEFFILIGLYVGTLVQTFVFDRAKRKTNLTATQWYLSKTMLMWVTGMVQATVLILITTVAGWHILGAARIFELWLWFMATETIFVITIQALWFSLKDETIGKFLCIIYMVLNLSSGWGTFPAYMQFGFFNVVSHITEFTYSLHGMGEIIYGSNDMASIGYVLEQFGFLLIFAAVFLTIGLLCAKNRRKEMHYGSYKAKNVAHCLEELNNVEVLNAFKIQKPNGKFKYSWKSLPEDPMMDVVEKMRQLHPYEGQFKSFKNKEHDPVLKPNYSDDDIMSRNDEVQV